MAVKILSDDERKWVSRLIRYETAKMWARNPRATLDDAQALADRVAMRVADEMIKRVEVRISALL